jgi:hypothetical protein
MALHVFMCCARNTAFYLDKLYAIEEQKAAHSTLRVLPDSTERRIAAKESSTAASTEDAGGCSCMNR